MAKRAREAHPRRMAKSPTCLNVRLQGLKRSEMDQKTASFVVMGLFAYLIHRSDALITCYSCNSTTTSNCLDPFSVTGVNVCNGGSCTKYIESVSGKMIVRRGCQSAAIDSDICNDMATTVSAAKSCECRIEYCNDSSMLKPMNKMIVAVNVIITVAMTVTWVNN